MLARLHDCKVVVTAQPPFAAQCKPMQSHSIIDGCIGISPLARKSSCAVQEHVRVAVVCLNSRWAGLQMAREKQPLIEPAYAKQDDAQSQH